MGLFSRKKRTAQSAPVMPQITPIADFWRWWTEAGHWMDPTAPSEDSERLTELVHAIHPELSWHFGPGDTAEHRLTVSASGVAEVRPYAERWRRSAPKPTAMWEFASSQQADPSALQNVLQLGDARLDLALTRFDVEVAEAERRVHVHVFHPEFARLPEDVCTQISFLITDWALGEDDLERWVGVLGSARHEPPDAVDGEKLRATVAELADACDPDGWMLLRGQDEHQRAVFVMARSGVRWIDRPTLDRHHLIEVTFDTDPDGQPATEEVAKRLEIFEDELVRVVEPAGLFVARQTCAGIRSFHVYTDGEDQNADDQVTRFTSAHGVRHEATPDPGWTAVRAFIG